jgi:hypothetical protein
VQIKEVILVFPNGKERKKLHVRQHTINQPKKNED